MIRYLHLRLQSQFFGLPLSVVEEILPLPELTCIPDAPGDVLGVVNWRGKTLPVVHLAKRLGMSQPKCYISDHLVVISHDNLTVGIVVNQVQDTIEIDEGQIDRTLQQFQPPLSFFLQGVALFDGMLIPLIDPAHLIRSPEAVGQLAKVNIDEIEGASLEDFYTRFVVDVSSKERLVFQQRRLDLLTVSQQVLDTQTTSLALVEIGRETVAIPLAQIQEFIHISDPVPVPFSPAFVIGNVSLRGEILTLIDISGILGLSSQCRDGKQALVFQWRQNRLGISVSQVRNIANVDRLALPSTSTRSSRSGVIGTIVVAEKPATLLDLREIICDTLAK